MLIVGVLMFYTSGLMLFITMSFGNLDYAPIVLVSLAFVLIGAFYAARSSGPGGRFAVAVMRWLVAAPLIVYYAQELHALVRYTIMRGIHVSGVVPSTIVLSFAVPLLIWPEIMWLARKCGLGRLHGPAEDDATTEH